MTTKNMNEISQVLEIDKLNEIVDLVKDWVENGSGVDRYYRYGETLFWDETKILGLLEELRQIQSGSI